MEALARRKKKLTRRHIPGKNATKSWKTHTFEPFSQRVAKVKIDPIRRPRGHQIDDLDLAATSSHFRNALENWNESNLSENYSIFSRAIDSISDSLPQIIHHEDQIVDNLDLYLRQGSSVSLEPLLDLVSQLAHDLGARFMKHFYRMVDTLAHLATVHTDIDVIEWTFNCMTWLFKYLSKLLVPDLCPLYAQLAPLLGKGNRQKYFVTRFTAEAFSFLLRRASALYERDTSPLQNIITRVMDDVRSLERGHNDGYLSSISNMLTEAIGGVNNTISSTGKAVLSEVISSGLQFDPSNPLPFDLTMSIVQEMVVAILGHLDAAHIPQVVEVIMHAIEEKVSGCSAEQLAALFQMLMHCIVIKRGQGVTEWDRVFGMIKSSMVLVESDSSLAIASPHVLATFALALRNAPIDGMIKNIKVVDQIPVEMFLKFSHFYAELHSDRFKTIITPALQRYVSECSRPSR
jgi:U3 small nucleolar RNA-associated protein 20